MMKIIDAIIPVAIEQTVLLTNQRAAVSLSGRRFAASIGLVRALGGGWDGDLRVVEATGK
jgi:outer membrane protein TolC